MARTHDVALELPTAVTSSAWALSHLDEAGEAANRIREGQQLVEHLAARGVESVRSWQYHAPGRACSPLGRLHEARRLAECALELSRHYRGFAAHALYLLGDIATSPDPFDAEAGEAHYREALALAEPRGMRPLVAHCHLSLGRLYRRRGKREQAREHLTTAVSMYGQMGMRFWLEQAEMELTGAV